MKRENIEKLTCTKCGFHCSSILNKGGGRFLEDRSGNIYFNSEPISKCSARYYIEQGIPIDDVRKTINKGKNISNIPSVKTYF